MCDLELKLNLNKLVSSCFASCSTLCILHLHESTIVNIYIYLDRLGLSHTYVVFVDCYVVFCCNMYICIRNGLRLNLLRRTILRKYLKISFQEPQFYILLYLRNHSNTINCILSLFIYHMTPGPKVGHTANIMALF